MIIISLLHEEIAKALKLNRKKYQDISLTEFQEAIKEVKETWKEDIWTIEFKNASFVDFNKFDTMFFSIGKLVENSELKKAQAFYHDLETWICFEVGRRLVTKTENTNIISKYMIIFYTTHASIQIMETFESEGSEE